MEKKSVKIVAIVFLVLLGLGLFLILKDKDNSNNKINNEDVLKFKEEYEAINSNNAVKVIIDENSPIEYLEYSEFEEKLNSGASFVVYLGFPTCPWCRNIINPLFDVALENNSIVYYINVRELKKDTENFDKLFNVLYDYLDVNPDGVKTLYVPDVYFFKDKKIVGHHLDTVDSQTDPTIPLTENQLKELKDIYQGLFDKLK